jgi:hypothetical protein
MHQLWDPLLPLSPHIPILLILASACLIGITTIVRYRTALSSSIQRKNWPQIQSKIIRYEVSLYTTGGQSSQTKYAYTTISAYEIQDQWYVNEYAWHGGFATWQHAENKASQICPIGQSVKLIYNPSDPQQSRHPNEMGWDWGSFGGICLGITLLSVGAGLLLAAILYIYGMPLEKLSNIIQPFLVIGGISLVLTFLCSAINDLTVWRYNQK